MRIGVHASSSRRDGGQFQFTTSVLDALRGSPHEVMQFYFEDGENLAARYPAHWVALPRRPGGLLGPTLGPVVLSWIQQVSRTVGLEVSPAQRGTAAADQGAIRDFLAPYNLDLMLFPQWTDGCWDWGVPYACAVHDLQHRLQPEFPEVSMFGKWAQREEFFSRALPAARIVIVDSEVGREHVSGFYGIDKSRIRVLPYTTPPAAPEKSESVEVPGRFFLYPAQFWPHKNHYRVVEAIGLLKREGVEVNVVFAGTDPELWGVADTCRRLAAAHGVANQLRFPGYVADAALQALYRGAVGLVMPTFFGPTNIPYLEAFQLGCPVIAPDVPGIREQVGDAAVLVDPRSSADIARAMRALWTDETLRARLVAAGAKQLQEFSPAKFRSRLLAILEDALRS
jgi:glycosyltransferase involved in cell wall biosynthesis